MLRASKRSRPGARGFTPGRSGAMVDRLVRGGAPLEFFREQLGLAMEHQKVSTSAFTEYYLVNLLAACVRGESLPQREPGYDETPLALLYLRALDASRHERARMLRAMGDTALFISGFFADSLTDKHADLRYYRTLGGMAYERLSRDHEQDHAIGPAGFTELAARLRAFADAPSAGSQARPPPTPRS